MYGKIVEEKGMVSQNRCFSKKGVYNLDKKNRAVDHQSMLYSEKVKDILSQEMVLHPQPYENKFKK